jgi:outer membrane protein assembly factor BamA
MCRHLCLLLVAISLCVAVRPAASQKFLPKAIKFQGDPDYTTDELMEASGLKLGTVLSRDDMNDIAKKLMATGVFDQLAYKFDGQDLIFTMTPASELFPVRIENLPLTPGPTLDADLHKRFPLYHGMVPSEGSLLDSVRGALEEMLAAEGIAVSVTAVPYGDRKVHNKVTAMSFAIASPPVRLGKIQFEGASPGLLPRLQSIAQTAPYFTFDSNNTADALTDRFTSFYENLGYAAVNVKVTQSGYPVMGADAIQVPELVRISEGEVYKITAVHLPSDCLVPQDEADKIMATRDDRMPGSNFRMLLLRIDNQYKSKGYLDLVVTPHPEFDEAAATVSYVIEISPGAVYHVAYVKFEDVSDDLRSHLMRAWQLLPGDPVDISYIDAFMTKALAQDPVLKRSLAGVLAHFETSADPVTHDVDIVIRLER